MVDTFMGSCDYIHANAVTVHVDNVEMLLCMHCGRQAGDCSHTTIDYERCHLCDGKGCAGCYGAGEELYTGEEMDDEY